MTKKDLDKRKVTGPDGEKFEVDPLRDYFCQERPRVHDPARRIWEGFLNWARSESLWILGYGTGCGAIEMRPLMTPRFTPNKHRIQWRPTPWQSNVPSSAAICPSRPQARGPGSYEQMQGPKYVVALGSCTINGGMYWDSYNTINRLDKYLPVDVYITGCMPRPESLLAGFEKLKTLIREGRGEGQNLYAKHFDEYKANQKKIIRDWDMPDYNW